MTTTHGLERGVRGCGTFSERGSRWLQGEECGGVLLGERNGRAEKENKGGTGVGGGGGMDDICGWRNGMDGWMQERFRDGRHPWLGGMALGRGLDDGPWMVPCGGASPLGGPPVAARRALAGCKWSGGQVPVGSRPGIGSRAAVDDLHRTHGCPYYLRYARKHATPSAADLRKAHLIIQGSTYPSTPGAARADLTSMTRCCLAGCVRPGPRVCLRCASSSPSTRNNKTYYSHRTPASCKLRAITYPLSPLIHTHRTAVRPRLSIRVLECQRPQHVKSQNVPRAAPGLLRPLA